LGVKLRNSSRRRSFSLGFRAVEASLHFFFASGGKFVGKEEPLQYEGLNELKYVTQEQHLTVRTSQSILMRFMNLPEEGKLNILERTVV
jgi:hypothetical protein